MTTGLSGELRLHDSELDAGLDLRTERHSIRAADAYRFRAAANPSIDRGTPSSVLDRESLQRRLLAVADVVAVTVIVTLVLDVKGPTRAALVAVAMPLVVIPFKIAGLYDRDELRLARSTLDEAPALLQLTALFTLGVMMLRLFLVHGAFAGHQIAELWLGTFAATLGGRVLARWVATSISPVQRCLVIGAPDRAHQIGERLVSSSARATVVASLPLSANDIDDLGGPGAIRHVVDELEVHRIVIAPATDATDCVGLIRIAKAVGVPVSVLPPMFEAVGSSVEFDDVDGMTMLGIRPFGLTRSSRALKRCFDLAAASLGLLLAAPLMAIIAVAIVLDSKGPVLFRQVRVGRNGRHFRVLKFRSMVVDAEERKNQLRARNEAGAGLFKIAHDPRITHVGAFLRSTSLDELPQLLNVIRGEMSLVGPRPLVIEEDAQVVGLDRSRLHLTPGMTGPWQVLGARVPIEEMVAIDYLYVANWSLWLDLKLLVRTGRKVVRRGNL